MSNQSEEFIVREASFRDVPQMCRLLSYLFGLETDFLPDPERQAQGLSLLLADRSGLSAIFVAAHSDQVYGMCSVQVLLSTAEGGRAAIVEDVVVHPDRQGSGIGSALLHAAVGWCRERGVSRMQLLADAGNADALAFYQNQGLTRTNLVCLRKTIP